MPFKQENTPDKQAIRGLFRQLAEEDMAPETFSTEDASVEDQIPTLIVDEDAIVVPRFHTEQSIPLGERFSLILDGEELSVSSTAKKADEAVTTAPLSAVRRPPLPTLWKALKKRLPRKSDSKKVLLRKLALLSAVAVAIGGVGFLLYDTAVNPVLNQGLYQRLAAQYRQEGNEALAGIGPQAKGWLTYVSAAEQDFLAINYPVVQGEDNDSYRGRDVYGRLNRNGALYFHKDNHLEEDNYNNKVLVIYGNNSVTGQMFSSLNTLVGPVNYARKAAIINLNTLYEENAYKVFALIVTDEAASEKQYFDPCRLNFPTNGTFMEFVEQLQARSLFDYPVDVVPGDQLLMLSTELSASVSGLKQARLTVVARKVRHGEGTQVIESEIVKNDDAILPYAMYKKQGRDPHPYYESGELPQNTVTTTATTTTATTTRHTETTAWDIPVTDVEQPTDPTDSTTATEGETTTPSEGDSTAVTDDVTDTVSGTDTTETVATDDSAETTTDTDAVATVGDTTTAVSGQ